MRTTRVFCTAVATGLLAVAMGGVATATEGPGPQTKDVKGGEGLSGIIAGHHEESVAKIGSGHHHCRHECDVEKPVKPAHHHHEKPVINNITNVTHIHHHVHNHKAEPVKHKPAPVVGKQTRRHPVGAVAAGSGGSTHNDNTLMGMGAALAVAGAGAGAFALRRGSLRG
ncbi:hypothetical protein [Embleya sp. AB8]|uniref:hypothetical protein n=1 Tax=Embleya sp. AB8 TaxID=3156304 RepID=UPI003C709322